jgi:TonB family protein
MRAAGPSQNERLLLIGADDVRKSLHVRLAHIAGHRLLEHEFPTRAELYAHLAQAEAKSGQRELISRHWREATFLEPGRMPQVPADIASQLSSIEPISPDRIWYPLPNGWLAKEDLLPTGQPSYFFVTAGVDGKVQSARELDSDDPVALKILPAVRSISFPVVTADGHALSTVHLVKVLRESNGQVLAGHSVAPAAVAIAGELAPAEFPLPVTASPGVPSGAMAGMAQGVSQPRILENSPPRYSEEARKAGLAGRVQVVCVVGSDGIARDFKVAHSLGLGLDESAIRAVSVWRFAPGVKDGKPVNVAASVDVNFQILGRDGKPAKWRLARVQFESVAGATRPVVETAVPPRISGEAGKGTAIATFVVDEQGSAVDVHVEQSSDEAWGKEVGNALHKWKFTPALRDGMPVRVSCTMEFERGR